MNINTLETETIKPVYHVPEPDAVAQPVQGYVGKKVDRKTYSEAEMSSISQDIDKPKGNKSKSSKTA
jgi:hypothetical protein